MKAAIAVFFILWMMDKIANFIVVGSFIDESDLKCRLKYGLVTWTEEACDSWLEHWEENPRNPTVPLDLDLEKYTQFEEYYDE